MSHSEWMIYGAYGFTGTLITEEAVRRGHHPILMGRSKEKLLPLAKRFDLDWEVVDLLDEKSLFSAVKKVDLVLNAAGPFTRTCNPLIRACLDGSCHYVDIANEIPVWEILQSYDLEARQVGIALLSGAGFGVIATNCLAKYVADQLPDATELACASVAYTEHRSTGALKTVIEMLPNGGMIRREGKKISNKLGKGVIQVSFPEGIRTLVPVPTGDLEAAYLATGIPNVTAYSADFPSSPVISGILPAVQKLLKINSVRAWVERRLDKGNQKSESERDDTEKHSYAWARAIDRNGKEFQAWLTLGEGYRFTADSSLLTVEKILQEQPSGALTPAQAFGADFVLEIPGTIRYTTLPATIFSTTERRG